MRALTVLQPWASLIAFGWKRYETRSWKVAYRGELAIHAGKKLQRRQERILRLDENLWQPLAISGVKHERELPRGAIVAVGVLIGCHPTECLSLPDEDLCRGDFTPGRFGWLLADVFRLPKPIPCRGAQGLWAPPEDVQEAIRTQLPKGGL